MKRWLVVLVLMLCVAGCEDLEDFFESGFDDSTGTGTGENRGPVTETNLQGTWVLDVNASTLDDLNTLSRVNLVGDWDFVNSSSASGFPANFEANPNATGGVLTFNEDAMTFTFVSSAPSTTTTFAYRITGNNTLIYERTGATSTTTTTTIQAQATLAGNSLNLVINGNTGRFTVPPSRTVATRAAATQYCLVIGANTIETRARANGGDITFTENYTRVPDTTNMLSLTDPSTSSSTNLQAPSVQAGLSSDNNRLSLTIPDNSNITGNFTKQAAQAACPAGT